MPKSALIDPWDRQAHFRLDDRVGFCHLASPSRAGVVKLVDAPDSKSGSARSVGSIPTARTILLQNDLQSRANCAAFPHAEAWRREFNDRSIKGFGCVARQRPMAARAAV
jgi:hypothetical protein